ncbi:MAG: M23 family metallopeptidase [Rhodospirillales bacterium]|nr:M23 family metallopeptidase [Rhodospirillales bacterium]
MMNHFDFARATLLVMALGFACVLGPGPGFAQSDTAPFALALPLDCVPGESCWIANYVDVDPEKGASDYTCGGLSYDTHKGVDFAIADVATMDRGVSVLAAAPGLVVGVRDGMADVSIRDGDPDLVKGKECGNGVGVTGPDGWFMQYCHLMRGSIAVKKGDRIETGQVLGLVGLSGRTEFPHVHLQVMKDRKVVDPFVGLGRKAKCGLGSAPLWRADVLAKLPYQPAKIYIAGFAGTRPTEDGARKGRYRAETLSVLAPALVFWADIFGPRKGDELVFRIDGPNGKKVVQTPATLKKDSARRFVHIALKRPGPVWPKGVYVGEMRLNGKGAGEAGELVVRREVTLR